MAEQAGSNTRPAGQRTDRLKSFSDGVFAIAITLLVLELAVPAATSESLLRALANEWPSYLAYLVSFASIGAIWLQHSIVTDYLERADDAFLRINLALLLVVSFLPFPTKVIAEYMDAAAGERVAVTVYGATLLAAFLLISILWRYGVRAQLVSADAGAEEVEVLTRRLTPGLAAYAVMIAVGLLAPRLAVFGYAALAVFFLVPIKGLASRRR
jgi:uncharacterized membrane protein